MPRAEKARRDNKMTITIQGHEVSLTFAEEPNPQVAIQVKQALLGNYLAAGSK